MEIERAAANSKRRAPHSISSPTIKCGRIVSFPRTCGSSNWVSQRSPVKQDGGRIRASISLPCRPMRRPERNSLQKMVFFSRFTTQVIRNMMEHAGAKSSLKKKSIAGRRRQRRRGERMGPCAKDFSQQVGSKDPLRGARASPELRSPKALVRKSGICRQTTTLSFRVARAPAASTPAARGAPVERRPTSAASNENAHRPPTRRLTR